MSGKALVYFLTPFDSEILMLYVLQKSCCGRIATSLCYDVFTLLPFAICSQRINTLRQDESTENNMADRRQLSVVTSLDEKDVHFFFL